jgi:hypothetical protein
MPIGYWAVEVPTFSRKCYGWGSPGSWNLFIVRNSKCWTTQRFGYWICFRPQVRGERNFLLGPSVRANMNQWTVLVTIRPIATYSIVKWPTRTHAHTHTHVRVLGSGSVLWNSVPVFIKFNKVHFYLRGRYKTRNYVCCWHILTKTQGFAIRASVIS